MVSAHRCLFVADPLGGLRVQSDSSLALLREGQKRGWQTYWATPDTLSFHNGDVHVRARLVATARPDALPTTASEQSMPVAGFSLVFVRKDPPFDTSYLRMCWWLGLEESRTRFVNAPSLLVRFHEKLLPWEAVARGFLRKEQVVPTYTADVDAVQALFAEYPERDYVLKPFFGFAGSSVERWNGRTLSGREAQLAQPFQKAIHSRGDRRVLYAFGERIGDFVRRPPEGGFVSNLAAGGSAERLPMSPEETAVAEGLGRFLASLGMAFAGADLIGDRLSEVNITSPTGILALKQLENIDGAARLWDALERTA
jgi:glutathione synthase